MTETKRAVMGTTLTLNTMKDPNPEKPFDIIEQLLSKDIDYTSEDETGPAKGEHELEEDLGDLSSGPLEMEEISDIHEETPVPTSELEVDLLAAANNSSSGRPPDASHLHASSSFRRPR